MLLRSFKCVTAALPFIFLQLLFLSIFRSPCAALSEEQCLGSAFTAPPGLKAHPNSVRQTQVQRTPEPGSTVIPLPVVMELPAGLVPGSEIIATISWTGLGEGALLEVAGLFGDVFLHFDINQPDAASDDLPLKAHHADFIAGTWAPPEPVHSVPLSLGTLHTIMIRLGEDLVYEFFVDHALLFRRKHAAPYHPAAATKVSLWCHGGEPLCLGLRKIAAVRIPAENLFDFSTRLSVPVARAPPRVFVGVLSAPQNSDRRQNIRQSYLKHPRFGEKGWELRFFVGRAKNPRDNELVGVEAQLYGDLVVDLSLEESYRNITRKTLAILGYGSLAKAEFIFKADDDTFIHVDRVDALLSSLQTGFHYIGKIADAAGPIREKENKWYMPLEEWPEEVYPPFAFGCGYLISNLLASSIVEGHQRDSAAEAGTRELRLLHLEDVAVGTWVDHLLQKGVPVEYIHVDDFPSIGCVRGGYIAHNMEHHEMACMWRKLSDLKAAGVDPRHQDYCCGAQG